MQAKVMGRVRFVGHASFVRKSDESGRLELDCTIARWA